MGKFQCTLLFSMSLHSLAAGQILGYTSFEEPMIVDPAAEIPDYVDPLGERVAKADQEIRELETTPDGAVLSCAF